jgi:hypothetical protein
LFGTLTFDEQAVFGNPRPDQTARGDPVSHHGNGDYDHGDGNDYRQKDQNHIVQAGAAYHADWMQDRSSSDTLVSILLFGYAANELGD